MRRVKEKLSWDYELSKKDSKSQDDRKKMTELDFVR